MQDNDMATLGRCANNLGIIANMQGDYGRAVGAYTRAIAAYEAAGYDQGIAESHHNLAIAFREQGHLDEAMQAADTAVREAERLGDRRLKAQGVAGGGGSPPPRGGAPVAVRRAGRGGGRHPGVEETGVEAAGL